jgi:hypothetical protein
MFGITGIIIVVLVLVIVLILSDNASMVLPESCSNQTKTV